MLDLRSIVAGVDEIVPTLGGADRSHVDLDNATATPVLWPVIDAVGRLLPLHAAAHRGTSYKARVSTEAYEQALGSIGRFVGADPERDVVVVTADPIGALHGLTRGRVPLVAVRGASGATGLVHPVHELAERVHAAGGRIAVDATHLASHHPIDMRPHGDPGHLDVVALSGHTMYAPFGSGALVGDRASLLADHADGGGATRPAVATAGWDPAGPEGPAGPDAPVNVLGAVALGAAAGSLAEIGLERIAAHESKLVGHATAGLASVPGITVHGPARPEAARGNVGIVRFSPEDVEPALVAAILGYEHAVGVRSGCFGAGPDGTPETVRLSLGFHNRSADIDRVVDALGRIMSGDIAGVYRPGDDGAHHPRGYVEPRDAVFGNGPSDSPAGACQRGAPRRWRSG